MLFPARIICIQCTYIKREEEEGREGGEGGREGWKKGGGREGGGGKESKEGPRKLMRYVIICVCVCVCVFKLTSFNPSGSVTSIVGLRPKSPSMRAAEILALEPSGAKELARPTERAVNTMAENTL